MTQLASLPVRLDIPSLRTARLELSGHRREDLDDFAAMWSEPQVTRYITGHALSREECWGRLLRAVGHWAVLGFGYWIVRERDSGRFVGEVGLSDLARPLEPALRGVPDVGWILAPWAHGQGYATEATTAALAWADAHLALPRLLCLVDPQNLPSLAVAARCQFTERTRTSYLGSEVIILERALASGT